MIRVAAAAAVGVKAEGQFQDFLREQVHDSFIFDGGQY